jgi:hypothetical protein
MGHMAYLRIYTTSIIMHITDHVTELNYTENLRAGQIPISSEKACQNLSHTLSFEN